MTFDQYEVDAQQFAVYMHPLYPFMALAEEAGEVAGKVAKHLRKHGEPGHYDMRHPNSELRDALIKELGDVLWQLSACANELGSTLDYIATQNLAKLTARQAAGTIVGEGDHR